MIAALAMVAAAILIPTALASIVERRLSRNPQSDLSGQFPDLDALAAEVLALRHSSPITGEKE
jgi:hypothetical protein